MQNDDEYMNVSIACVHLIVYIHTLFSQYGKNCQNLVRKLRVLVISNAIRKDVIFQNSLYNDKSQRRIQNTVKHLRWSV